MFLQMFFHAVIICFSIFFFYNGKLCVITKEIAKSIFCVLFLFNFFLIFNFFKFYSEKSLIVTIHNERYLNKIPVFQKVFIVLANLLSLVTAASCKFYLFIRNKNISFSSILQFQIY